MVAGHNILLIDNDEQSARDIQRFLKVSAYTFGVSHASRLDEGLGYLKNHKPDIVLLDTSFVNETDFGAFKQMLEKEDIPVILLSDISSSETKKNAELAGASDYIVKNKINLFHLQKTILNTLKISETEARLDDTFNKFVAQQDSLYKLLNKTNSGILIVSKQNKVLFANDKAYDLLSERGENLAGHFTYRELAEDELVELRSGNGFAISIRSSCLDWNDEKANLFVLDKIKPEISNAESILADETLLAFLNSLHENILLLKENKVVFVNKPALQNLKLGKNDVAGFKLNDIFDIKGQLNDAFSVSSLFVERELDGLLKNQEGSAKPVRLLLKPMSIAGAFYQLLSVEFKNQQDQSAPKGRSDEDKFSTESVLHLASHDLREPVRTILNYVQLISENLKNKKYEAAGEYADFARTAADGMERLLTDLKVYIGLNDHNFSISKVSMKLLVADVLKQMKDEIARTGAEINVAQLPDVNADRDLVEKLVSQLVDNALKFYKKNTKPVIDIGFDKFDGNILFCIRDNGLGISKKYQEKIFELFERLNRVDEYRGNGLGLAVSKKIVELHGGRIWVESLPGFGSSFYFTLGQG